MNLIFIIIVVLVVSFEMWWNKELGIFKFFCWNYKFEKEEFRKFFKVKEKKLFLEFCVKWDNYEIK